MIMFEQPFQYVRVLNPTTQDANSILSLSVIVGGEIWWETVGEVFEKWHDQDKKNKTLTLPRAQCQPFGLTHSPPRQNNKENVEI